MQYELVGNNFPVVVCHLAAGEKMKTESGSMVWMDSCLSMETSGGGIGKMFGKALSGETLFQNIYTAQRPGKIAFGASFPGKILAHTVTPGTALIVQKTAFLASEMGVDLSVHFNKKVGGALFGGEGFIMQKLSGSGMAFLEVDGDLVEYVLAPGEELLVDTGNVVGFDETVTMSIERVHGAKNIFLGGEGLFHTKLVGPGKVWVQTMSFTKFVNVIAANIPQGNN